jgi:hypothetical protein
MIKFSTVAFMVMIAAPFPASAYTQEDAQACTPDAMRLCQAAIPDPDRVTACLIQAKRDLSPACASVMNRSTSASRDTQQNIQKTRY